MRLTVCVFALALAASVAADGDGAAGAGDDVASVGEQVPGVVRGDSLHDGRNNRALTDAGSPNGTPLGFGSSDDDDDDDDDSGSGNRDVENAMKERRDAYDRAMGVLETHQSVINAQRTPQPQLSSTFMSHRDILRSLPRPIRPYVRSAIGTITQLFQQSSTDKTNALRGLRVRPWDQLPADVRNAIQVVQTLAENGYEDAIFSLANMEMYGKYGTQVDLESAFSHYQQLSEINGNATAQYMLGFFYTAALGGVEQNNGLSLLYTTFAAMQEYAPAEITLGFKHLSGIGTPMSCGDALRYYQSVARKAIRYYASGPPLGRHLPGYRVRLSDEYGGAYGVRTSANSIRKVIKREDFNELLEYHQFKARKGDIKSCLTLADVYYHGHRYAPRKFSYALTYLSDIIGKTFTSTGKLRKGLGQADAHTAAEAAGMLGIMNWRGEGVKVNTAQAFRWLQIGASLGHGASLNALGKMHLEGVEVPADAEKAREYFKQAAEKLHPGGQVNFALATIDTSPKVAIANMKRAAESGHILAHYYLAEMYANGIVVEASCRMATTLYKYVAEKGDWLHSPVPDAHAAYKRGDMQVSLIEYMRAAEMGYDVGQLNAAFLLEHVGGMYPDKSQAAACNGCRGADGTDNARSAGTCTCPQPLFRSREAYDFQTLAYWTRAANQNVPDARVKQGDHYFYGRGVKPSVERAAAAYTIAAEDEGNSFAMWNLGWMYENGVGVKRDFHLAKRWYDKSLEVNENGRLAGQFSLGRLCIKYLWGWATGEDVGEGPLFFAPKPVSKEEEEESAAAEAVPEEHGQNDVQHLNHPDRNLDPEGWGEEGVGDDERDNMAGAVDEDDDAGTTAENVFFLVLFLAAAWMFLPFR